ncbi:MAG: 4Fe-4S binding protein [Deltaproteobacteria bacterium]
MKVGSIKLIYFSPTGTTQKVLEAIAEGITVKDVKHIDLTLPESAEKRIQSFSDELVIIGTPVYGGRVPVAALNRFNRLKADKTLAVLIVVYGNRDFEDALLELKNLTVALGCYPFAGGAFIGEHSYASEDVPIANGRPDSLDLQTAKDFGEKIRYKVAALQFPEDSTELKVPGSFPYEASGARAMAVSPVTRETICTLCGTCADGCPTAAIKIDARVKTETELCIHCCACIKNCPTGARVMEDSTWKRFAHWLNENCSIRKEPQLFGIG